MNSDLEVLQKNLENCVDLLIPYDKGHIRYDYLHQVESFAHLGGSFWLPGISDEALYFMCHNDVDPESVFICEHDKDTWLSINEFYKLLGCQMSNLYANGKTTRRLMLHEAMRSSNIEKYSCGHADFIGNVNACHKYNNTSTYTFDLIEYLCDGRLAQRCAFAFTHKVSVRHGNQIFDSYLELINKFQNKYGNVWMKWNFPYHNIYNYNFHPTILVALAFAVFADGYRIWVDEESRDYDSTRTNQALKMNKTIVHLEEGEFNLIEFLDSIEKIQPKQT